MRDELRALARDPAHAAILLDFDGTLSDIVARPDLARPVPGAPEVVAALAKRFGLVAVVSGRPTDEVRSLLGVDGVRYAGHYGAEEEGAPLPDGVVSGARATSASVWGARVEEKRSSVAVHFRQAADPEEARAALRPPLERLAAQHDLEVLEGKMVLELVPEHRPRKGEAVERLVAQSSANAALYAGDDLADLEAFAALDRLKVKGIATVKVAVRGAEEWTDLLTAADLVADSPSGLVEMLTQLSSGAHG